jgi:Asp-tRNA(Asn)/Glu-tRNA(Gln) amidotransferase A subunit family amidase
LCRIVQEAVREVDAWISPTSLDMPVAVADCDTLEKVMAWTRRGTHNTRPVNAFGQCAASIPIQHLGAELPVALQVACGPGQEAALLGICQSIEDEIGLPPHPDLSGLS